MSQLFHGCGTSVTILSGTSVTIPSGTSVTIPSGTSVTTVSGTSVTIAVEQVGQWGTWDYINGERGITSVGSVRDDGGRFRG